MDGGTASGLATRADEELAWDRDGTRPGDQAGRPPGDHDLGEPGEGGKAKPEDDGGKRDHLRSTFVALGIAAVAFVAAWAWHGNASSTYRIDSHWGAFTGLFILALAIERALEPISPRLGPNTTKAKKARDLACARAHDEAARGKAHDAVVKHHHQDTGKRHHQDAVQHHHQDAVQRQHEVDRCRRLTAVVTWGAATGLAFVLCSALNITLMQAVRSGGSGAPPFWADLLVTGLVVGAGTKPLHDLFSNIERVKESRSAERDQAR